MLPAGSVALAFAVFVMLVRTEAAILQSLPWMTATFARSAINVAAERAKGNDKSRKTQYD